MQRRKISCASRPSRVDSRGMDVDNLFFAFVLFLVVAIFVDQFKR